MRVFVIAFASGTFALQCMESLPTWPVAAFGGALLLAAYLTRDRHVVLRVVAAAASGAVLGYGVAAWRAQERLADALPRAWEGRDVELAGVVASLPQTSSRGTRFLLDVESAPGAIPRSISLMAYRAGDDDASPVTQVRAGERWRLTVRLKRPRGLANPHGFDFEAWALERGIRATGYVRAKPAAMRLDASVDGWPYTLHRWRGEIRERMRAHLGEAPLAGVLVALAIGDQDSIAPDDWEVFWRTGVGHLMSISGLHITMLAALAFALAFRVWARVPTLALALPARKAALVAGVAAALAYSLMTGYAVPAQRTFAMLAVGAACVLLDRHGSASRVLAVAALAVLLLDPWAVLSAGFWLSFGAVASIFYVMALRTGRQGKLHGAVMEQLAVTLAMLPMLMALFQEVSIVSPIANAFAIPVVSLVVVPLTLAGAFLPVPWLLDAAHALMQWLMVPLEALASWPSAMLESHAPEPWTVAAAVVGCLWLLAPRGVPMRALSAFWIAPMFLVVPPSPVPGEAWIETLDVGNGLALVVRTATHAIAYDAGPAWSDESDSGNRIVVPFLRGEGIPKLDGVVISHADDDHSGGAASIARSRDPPWLLTSVASASPLHEAFERSIRCEAGQRWSWDGVDFVVVHPHADAYEAGVKRARGASKPRKENDRSCVLRVATAGAAALLTGDAEARSEAEMLARDTALLRANVLVIPHHGSKTSSTPAFIDAVHPEVGILSVGHRNRFHHPAPAVVARYVERGVPLRRTDEEGELRVVLPANEKAAPEVIGRGLACRYWSERRCAKSGQE
jgi:competence protein ComEC